MNLTLKEVAELPDFQAQNIEGVISKTLKGISTDSRSTLPGELFVALRGENFDGNKFIDDAFRRGAACAVVDAGRERLPRKPLLVVENTTEALGVIAKFYRRKFSVPVIAVAGSNGKTSTKEMITAVLRKRYDVLSTKGNLNNHIGVPQTLFGFTQAHEIAVIEIGTNHPGELKYLCNILEPTHGIITNIGHEHLEFFKNLNGVAKEEGALFEYLRWHGCAFVNFDDKRVAKLSLPVKRKVGYGFLKSRTAIFGQIRAVDKRGCFTISVGSRGKTSFPVTLAVPGKHVASNALAAAAVGLIFGVPSKEIKRALGTFTGFNKRMEVFTAGGVTVLNDTYNANPDSVIPALETLQSMEIKGKKIVVLADMRELGVKSRDEHRKVGRKIGAMGFEYLLTFGNEAKYIYEEAKIEHGFHHRRQEEVSKRLRSLVAPGDAVLVKGSRGLKMEIVVESLREHLTMSGSATKPSYSKRPN